MTWSTRFSRTRGKGTLSQCRSMPGADSAVGVALTCGAQRCCSLRCALSPILFINILPSCVQARTMFREQFSDCNQLRADNTAPYRPVT